MAYVPNTADTEDQTQFKPGTPSTQPPVTSTGGGGPAGAQTGQGATATVAKGTPPPVTNLADYLSANAPQAVGMGQQIAGQVTQGGQKVTGDINADQAAVDAQVQGSHVTPNPDLVGSMVDNPSGFVTNPENLTDFLAQENANYTGPTTYESTPEFAAATGEVTNEVNNLPDVTNATGIRQLASAQEKNPTLGQTELDTALLTETPGAVAPISAAEQPFRGLGDTLSGQASAEDAAIQKAIADDLAASSGATAGLTTAQGNEAANLTSEQNTLQGIIDEYNKSVGIINPVTSNIESDIANFLAANPGLAGSVSGLGNPLAPFEGISTVGMPGEATYASPADYANIAALGKLGDKNLGTLPIDESTASEAQTFQLPQALQDAIGHAPGVENALQTEINDIGGAIDTAGGSNSAAAYQQQQQIINTTQQQIDTLQPQVNQTLTQLQAAGVTTSGRGAFTNPYPQGSAKYQSTQALLDSYNNLNGQLQTAVQTVQNAQQTAQSIAQNLQGLGGEYTGYQSLVDEINAELQNLGQVGVPTLNYAPNTLTDPVTGVDVNPVTAGKAAGTAIGAGAEAESALGAAGVGAGAGAAGLNGMSYADALQALSPTTEPAATSLSPAGTIGPAAAAAYGTSNIVRNQMNNPIKGGLETIGNQGLSLAAMSFPPQVFKGIENQVQNILKDIGSFFGGIF